LRVDDFLLQFSAPIDGSRPLHLFLRFPVLGVREQRCQDDKDQDNDNKTPSPPHFDDFVLDEDG
jgi:hypothetical protein